MEIKVFNIFQVRLKVEDAEAELKEKDVQDEEMADFK